MRLKKHNIDMAKNLLSSYELSLYVYIAQRVDQKGFVQRILMRDAIISIGFKKQSFYNCIYALESKGFLFINKRENNGFDILLNNNKFVDEKATGDIYLNLNYRILSEPRFHQASINLKHFILDALSFSSLSTWKLSSDTLKKYKLKIADLKPFARNISSYSNAHNEIIHSVELSSAVTRTDNNLFFSTLKHKLTNFFSVFKIPYTMQSFKDVVQLWINNRELPGIVGASILKTADFEILQPALINHHIKNAKKHIGLII